MSFQTILTVDVPIYVMLAYSFGNMNILRREKTVQHRTFFLRRVSLARYTWIYLGVESNDTRRRN